MDDRWVAAQQRLLDETGVRDWYKLADAMAWTTDRGPDWMTDGQRAHFWREADRWREWDRAVGTLKAELLKPVDWLAVRLARVLSR